MSGFTRRAALGITAGSVAALAGCLGGSDDDDPPEPDNESAELDEAALIEADLDGTILGDVAIENLEDAAHTIDVIVEFDGSNEQWTTHDLAADEGTTLERQWPHEPGDVRVTVRLDQDETIEVRPVQWNDPNCLNLFVLVTRAGEFEVWGDTTGGPCGGPDSDVAAAIEAAADD